MTFRASKSKPKSTENTFDEVTLTTLSMNKADEHHLSDIEKLQKEIEINEKSLNIFSNHALFTLDANIDDLKFVIDQKRSEQKIYKLSMCELWLRLKTIEHMEAFSLTTFLHTNRLHRSEIYSFKTNNNTFGVEQLYLTNPRRSRLTHFHICTGSDEFNLNTDSYVGLLIFSYDNQLKFMLNGHYCQRGDIIVKQIKNFSQIQTANRGVYDALFKWYFGRLIDEKFFGIGFTCSNGKCRFDLITFDDKELSLYEYRIFDMFMLTHWLTQFNIAHSAREMEINAKDMLLERYNIVKKKLMHREKTELNNNWKEFIGSDVNGLQPSIEKFLQMIDKEIEIFLEEMNTRTNVK